MRGQSLSASGRGAMGCVLVMWGAAPPARFLFASPRGAGREPAPDLIRGCRANARRVRGCRGCAERDSHGEAGRPPQMHLWERVPLLAEQRLAVKIKFLQTGT